MKKYIFIIIILLLQACQSKKPNERDPGCLSKKIMFVDINGNDIFGSSSIVSLSPDDLHISWQGSGTTEKMTYENIGGKYVFTLNSPYMIGKKTCLVFFGGINTDTLQTEMDIDYGSYFKNIIYNRDTLVSYNSCDECCDDKDKILTATVLFNNK